MFKWEKLRGSLFYKAYINLSRKLEEKIVKGAIFSVAAGAQLKKKYQNFGCKAYETSPRITLTRNAIYERNDTCLGQEKIIVTVGNLVHDKAQHILIESFYRAKIKNPSLKLKIVGHGPKERELKDQVINLKISNNVDFLGFIEDEKDLYKILKGADLFVLTSITEGFPRVLYEAMAHRIPIVTTDVGGIPFLLSNKKNAMVVEVNNVEKIATSILKIISDKKLRRSLIKSASNTLDAVFEKVDTNQIPKLIEKHL